MRTEQATWHQLRALDWDSELLGIPCGCLDVLNPPPVREGNLVGQTLHETVLGSNEYRLIVLKLDCRYSTSATYLIQRGARLIDTELTFVHGGKILDTATNKVVFSNKTSPEPFEPLAMEMPYSRFFLDPQISKEAARDLWVESIRNHCQGFADLVAVAMDGDSPAGLVTINFTEGSKISLHIVGVLPSFRRRGHGRMILAAIAAKYGDNNEIRVEASAMNGAAHSLYQGAGFVLEQMRYTLHFWL